MPKSNSMFGRWSFVTRIRRTSVILLSVIALAGGAVMQAPHASAAAVWEDGDLFGVDNARRCGSNDTDVISTQMFAGVLNPGAGEIPARGELFRLRVIVGRVSATCASRSEGAGIFLKLPPGVNTAIDSLFGRVICIRSQSDDPSNSTNFSYSSADCPQSPPVVNGFLALNPPGFTGWSLESSQNLMEIQVPVRATQAGVFNATARVCDFRGPSCTDSPAGNAQWNKTFEVAEPPAYASPFKTASTPTSISTRAFVTSTGGTATAELRTQGDFGTSTLLETESFTVASGTAQQVDATFDAAPFPGRVYQSRTCFRPTNGRRACGPLQFVHGGVPNPHQLSSGAATNVGSTSATISGTLTGQRIDGNLAVFFGPTTSYGQKAGLGASITATRSTTASVTRSGTITGLARNTTFHYRVCYGPSGFISSAHCTADRTFRTAS